MKRSRYLFILLSALLFFLPLLSISACAAPSYTGATPEDDASNIWVRNPQLAVTINELTGQTITGVITFNSTGETYTLTGVTNGTFYLNLSASGLPLEQVTAYTWSVHARNDTHTAWTNTTFTFTTAASSKMRDSTSLDASQIALVIFISIVLVLGLIVIVWDINENKKFDPEKLIMLLITVIILVTILSFI